MIGSEAVPFSKTGGLADVLGSLPTAIARLGWDVTVVMPRYRGVIDGILVGRVPLKVGGYVCEPAFFEVPLGAGGEVPLAAGGRVLLVDVPDLFDRESIYGAGADYPDSPRRFAVLARAAFEWCAVHGTRPSIVHAHDWQGGLAPVYLKTFYAAHPVLGGVPSVFTIHNLAYQGLAEPDWLPRLDLPWSLFAVEGLEFWGRISLLKGGINNADLVTTVSPTYAREIQTPEFGFGFEGILRRRADELVGILNGVDTERWDPARDPHIPEPYTADDLTGKRAAKRTLLERYGLVADAALSRPLIGLISRMVDQKGFDLLASLGDELAGLDASFVVLGSGEPLYQDFWTSMAERYPDRIGVRIGFDEPLSHLIEAGADVFLMPSRFEPCGLNQMYSLRYGTVPVVRAVGGLADTVVNHDPRTRRRANGFSFDAATPEALLDALSRALAVFGTPRVWQRLQSVGMRQDHSWHRSAREYVRMYEKLLGLGARPEAGSP